MKDSLPTEDGIQMAVDNAKDFKDTQNHWAQESIDFVSARGLVNGTSENTFDPNAASTRAQIAAFLHRSYLSK